MTDLTKSFSDAFTKGRKGVTTFSDEHKIQIDALSDVVDALNAQGSFAAEIDGFTSSDSIPVLKIEEKSSGKGQTFFIDFGHSPFGGMVTLKLSTGLDRKPVGDKNDGYNMQYENERDELFALVGAAVAKKCTTFETGAAALAYAKGKKGQTR